MFRRKDDAAAIMAALKRSDKGPFENAIKELNNAGGGDVAILKRSTPNAAPGEKGTIPVAEVAEDPNFFETIRKQFKDGIYTFKLWTHDKKEHSEHHFGIGDISAKRTASKDDNGKDRKSESFKDELILRMMDKMMDRESDNGMGSIKEIAEAFTAVAGVFNQGGGGGGSSEVIGAFMDGFQLRGEVQPQLEREEPMTALLTSFIPLIGQMAANRSGGNQQFSPGQIQEIQSLRDRIQRLTSDTSAPGPVQQEHPSPPGVPTGAAAGPEMSGAGSSPGPSASPSDPIQRFSDRFITPFRADAAAGVDDAELAYQIVAMAQYARDRMADMPPLVADFITATSLPQYEAALAKFFAAIPELSSLQHRQAGIKGALMQMFVGTQTASEVPPVQEAEVAESLENVEVAPVQEAEVVESTESVDQADAKAEEIEDHTLEVLHGDDADRTIVGDAETQTTEEQQDQPDGEGDRTEVGHEAVRSEV